MAAAAYLLLTVGAGLLVWMILRRAPFAWDLLIFLLGCVLLWLRYAQTPLLAYDDFSHWGLIARLMSLTGKLPDASTALITFQSYPPATACWIAFVCRFWGISDGLMLAAQAWMLLAALWTLTAWVRGRYAVCKAIAVLLFMLAALSLFQGTASLMVDNILAALAVGVTAMVLWGCSTPLKSLALATPALTVLVLVKDSGLFFMAILWGLMWVVARPRHKPLLVPVVSPLAARALWRIHLKLVFPAAESTKHAFSLANMRAMGSDKSFADL